MDPVRPPPVATALYGHQLQQLDTIYPSEYNLQMGNNYYQTQDPNMNFDTQMGNNYYHTQDPNMNFDTHYQAAGNSPTDPIGKDSAVHENGSESSSNEFALNSNATPFVPSEKHG